MHRLAVKKPLAISPPQSDPAARSWSTWYHCGSKRRAKATISSASMRTSPRSKTRPGTRSSNHSSGWSAPPGTAGSGDDARVGLVLGRRRVAGRTLRGEDPLPVGEVAHGGAQHDRRDVGDLDDQDVVLAQRVA